MPPGTIRRRLRGTLLGWFLGLFAGQARAEETSGQLFVARAPQALICPDTEALRARVEALMNRAALSSTAATSVKIEVQIAREEPGYRAVVRVSGTSSGVRELHDEGPGCENLADALAITVAVLLDWQGAPTSPTSPPRPPAPPASPSQTPAPSTAPPEVSAPGVALSLGGGVAPRILPRVAPFVALELELGWPRGVRWIGGGFWVPEQSRRFEEGTVFTGYAGGLALGCVPLPAGPVELGPCGGLTLGRFHARGEGYDQNDQATRLWLAPTLGLEGRGSLGNRLAWTLRALGHVPHRAQTISVGSVGTLDLPRAGVFVKIGLSVSIF